MVKDEQLYLSSVKYGYEVKLGKCARLPIGKLFSEMSVPIVGFEHERYFLKFDNTITNGVYEDNHFIALSENNCAILFEIKEDPIKRGLYVNRVVDSDYGYDLIDSNPILYVEPVKAGEKESGIMSVIQKENPAVYEMITDLDMPLSIDIAKKWDEILEGECVKYGKEQSVVKVLACSDYKRILDYGYSKRISKK